MSYPPVAWSDSFPGREDVRVGGMAQAAYTEVPGLAPPLVREAVAAHTDIRLIGTGRGGTPSGAVAYTVRVALPAARFVGAAGNGRALRVQRGGAFSYTAASATDLLVIPSNEDELDAVVREGLRADTDIDVVSTSGQGGFFTEDVDLDDGATADLVFSGGVDPVGYSTRLEIAARNGLWVATTRDAHLAAGTAPTANSASIFVPAQTVLRMTLPPLHRLWMQRETPTTANPRFSVRAWWPDEATAY